MPVRKLPDRKSESEKGTKKGVIGENGRYGFIEPVTDHPLVTFMGDFDKFSYRFFVHSVKIGLIVEPGRFFFIDAVSVPFVTGCFIRKADSLVVRKISVTVKYDIIAGRR